MPDQDPNPLPYGALPYYQVHYIVKTTGIDPYMLMAKCNVVTEGHFNNKRVVNLEWVGGRLANILQNDQELTLILKSLLLDEGEIRIDPQDNRVRIYTKWKREDKIKFDPRFFEAVEKIAAIIKSLNR
ncbi:MAG: hypothetical protein WB511_05530, partial [Nitrososphaeraceae archaeon]|jgi:hypothetical protein